MPFQMSAVRKTTRTFTIQWTSDQGEHDVTVTYLLGEVSVENEKETVEQFIDRAVVSWDVFDSDNEPIPPTEVGLKAAKAKGDELPLWFLLLVMDGVLKDCRPPSLTSRESADTL